MMKKILFGFVVVCTLYGCLKGENNFTCNYNACSYKVPASEIQEVQAFLTANNIVAQEHCSGLFYIIEAPGSGAEPTACGGVRATYVGSLTNGVQFDAGTADFALNQVIRGWTNGIPLIRPGGRIRLFVPPSLGYGDQPKGSIPAKSILVFEVDLVTVY